MSGADNNRRINIMARTIRTKIYKFDELSKDAQEKVIESFYDINIDYEWYEMTVDQLKREGEEKGFDIDNIYFSGFSSQGDGAMFEGSVNDFSLFTVGINPHVIKAVKNNCLNLSWSVKHRGHYYHSGCRAISFDAGNYPGYYQQGYGWKGNFQDNMDILENNIEAAYEDFCSYIYRTLEKEYEWRTSKEEITETILANGYEFTKDGKQF